MLPPAPVWPPAAALPPAPGVLLLQLPVPLPLPPLLIGWAFSTVPVQLASVPQVARTENRTLALMEAPWYCPAGATLVTEFVYGATRSEARRMLGTTLPARR